MENNVLDFSPSYIKQVRFGVRSVKLEFVKRRGDIEYNEYCIIVLENIETKRVVVHPLTSFIYIKWRNTEYNTQYARAKHVADFLNYTVIECYTTFRLKSLEDLKVEHGVSFLENKIKHGCSRGTIFSYDTTVMYLYHYLFRKEILKSFKDNDFQWKNVQIKRSKQLKSLFIPRIRKLPNYLRRDKKAKRLMEHHVGPFLQVALQVNPEIALGVYLSIFGGLRGSEVMAIKRSEISHMGPDSANGMIVRLSTDVKSAKSSGNRVKKPGYSNNRRC
ncbi:hypothetical protein [Paenibacillus odorifer]|uniref:Tyr recombinase domain-containing protein n=1 Tax=Paenibacillus odorifer TaxID=189426 RepID=A0A1R0Y817_9BACL|nr:hypothetical protein [Paenibacillus odorifer]OMD43481.1 hypothetical protein BSK52_03465 [Paenibacillus odorifer]